MSYKKELGRVKGNKGATLVPSITYTALGAEINWTTSDNEYDGPFPPTMLIEPAYYIPQYNAETGELSWINSKLGMPGYETMPEIPPMHIRGEQGDIGATEIDIQVIIDDGGYAEPENIINYHTNNNPQEGTIYIIGEEAYVYDNDTEQFYPIEKLVDLRNYYTKTQTHEVFFTKEEVYEWLASINEVQEAIIALLDNGVINIPIDQGSGEVGYQTLHIVFNEEYSDEPIIYVDGIPWNLYDKSGENLYLYQVPDGEHIIFYENGNEYSMLECTVNQLNTEFIMPSIAIKPTYNQTIITQSNGEDLVGCTIYFTDICDDANNITYHATDTSIIVLPIPIGYYHIQAYKPNYDLATIQSDNEYNTVLIKENGRYTFDLGEETQTIP